MKNCDESIEINHNPNWSNISDHPHRISIIGDSGSSKTNVLLNSNDQIFIKFICTSKIHSNKSINCLSVEEEKQGLKNPKTFIKYSQTIGNVYENLEDYDPTKKRKVLILFDDMITDMEANN